MAVFEKLCKVCQEETAGPPACLGSREKRGCSHGPGGDVSASAELVHPWRPKQEYESQRPSVLAVVLYVTQASS